MAQMKNSVCVIPPAIEPLTLDEAKAHLRIDEGLTADDDYISALITVAREYCESFQNRAYITQTWQVSFPYWPDYTIDLPLGNLQRIVAIKYKDSNGAEITLTENIHYVVSTRGVLGKVAPVLACLGHRLFPGRSMLSVLNLPVAMGIQSKAYRKGLSKQ